MGTQVTLVYTVPCVAATPAAMAARVGAVPVPIDILEALGLRVTADATPAANPVVRTIVLAFGPSIAAAATPLVTEEGRVRAIALGGDGLDYIVPPMVSVVDPAQPQGSIPCVAQARLRVSQVAIDAGGAGYNAASTICAFLGGLPPAPRTGPQCLRRVNIKSGGRGYPVGSTVQVLGDCTRRAEIASTFNALGVLTSVTVVDMGEGYQSAPELVINVPMGSAAPTERAELYPVMAAGRPARGTVTVVANVVTAIVVTDMGDGYVSPPTILITDPLGGAGAVARARMGVGRADILNPGTGYTPAATVTFTPHFKAMFPDVFGNAAQRAPFWGLMQVALARAGITPVTSAPPVVV